MEFYILNSDFEIIAALDTFKSAIWTRRFYEAGDFEIYAPADPNTLSLLTEGRIVIRADRQEEAGIIDTVKVTSNQEEGDYIIASGQTLQGVLNRRIVWKQTTLSGNPEKVVRRLITENMIEAEDDKRIIPQLRLGEPAGISGSMKAQYTGDNIADIVTGICKENRIGYRVAFDLSAKTFTFSLYEGVDRTYNQDAVPFVVFSSDFENLLSTDYTADGATHKNVIQVAGEGEGTARQKVIVATTNLGGIARKETFADARDVSSNSGELTALTYAQLLEQRGAQALAEARVIEGMESEIAANYSSFQIDRDFFLGDLVEIIDQYGHELTPRVTEVIESQDETGYTCIPTFSNDEE